MLPAYVAFSPVPLLAGKWELMMRVQGWGIVCLAICSGAFGCGGEGVGAETTATSTEALTFTPAFGAGNPLGYEYSWSIHGNSSVTLPAYNNNICFLSGISGIFKSSQDGVSVQTSQGGNWILGGTRGTGNPGGNAYCISGVPAGTPSHPWAWYTWTSGQAAVDMGTTSGRTCFLTAVKGNFTGTSDLVRTRRSNGTWYLDGDAASASNGITASAVCVPKLADDSFTWSTTYGQRTALPLNSLGQHYVMSANNGPTACFLTEVRGRFDTQAGASPPKAQAWIEQLSPSAWVWYLSGSASDSNLSDYDPGTRTVKARCVF